MRFIITFLVVIHVTFAEARVKESGVPAYYEVVSDSLDSTVPQGMTKISGNCMHQGEVLSKVLIATGGMTYKCYTDEEGNYEFLISAADSILFAYQDYFSELVIQTYDFLAQHHVVINFHLEMDMTTIEVDKPVIYLYSEKPITTRVSLEFSGDLTFSYPAYEDGWEVSVDSDGILCETDSMHYPYLFWEGEMTEMQYRQDERGVDGIWLSSEEVVPYLERSLHDFGLNAKERTDFITFWAPRMLRYETVFVQWALDDDYEELVGSTTVGEALDGKRSVYLLFSGNEESVVFRNEERAVPVRKAFERSGFYLVEWGGSEIPWEILMSQLKNTL